MTIERIVFNLHQRKSSPIGQGYRIFPIFPNIVTLNLFQGPSCRKPGASRIGANREFFARKPRSGCDEKWVLKQVQDDEQ